MTANRHYKLGNLFPYEAYIQQAIENHFRNAGYHLDTNTNVDLLCIHPRTGEAWHIEAKGKTSAIGLDFRTCLGQLLQRMSCPDTKHGLALPDLPTYQAQVAQVSSWIQNALQLHWIFVSADGSVRIVVPPSKGVIEGQLP